MPKIEQKQVVINEIKGKIEKAVSAVLVDARGLTVAQDTEFRRRLREAGIDYKVYKNTMMCFAVKDTPFEKLSEHFKGPSALAISYDDATKATRIIEKSAKDFKHIEFKAGVIENVLYDAEGVKKIAEIPTREELLSRLLGSFKSPMASFARVVNQIAEKNAEGSTAAAE